MGPLMSDVRASLDARGQGQILRFWDSVDEGGREAFVRQITSIDLPLMERLIDTWVLNTPSAERFQEIKPVPVIPKAEPRRPGRPGGAGRG